MGDAANDEAAPSGATVIELAAWRGQAPDLGPGGGRRDGRRTERAGEEDPGGDEDGPDAA